MTNTNNPAGPLVFAHIGDLHITRAKEQNYIDMLSIIAQIETQCSAQLDFAVLPGDNADNGLPEQYKLVATALKMPGIPVHVIPGDHDMGQGSLEGFYTLPGATQLPHSIVVNGVKCIFLDVCGPGSGGPDFRLGSRQLLWLQNELEQAKTALLETVIFVHTYPSDLKDESEKAAFIQLITDYGVALVDMGHTHYNELANNGNTIFSATRPTGQIEEGPVGYSLISVDNGVVSWRFKMLDDAFPFVLITSPADYRLIRKPSQAINGLVEINARIFGSHAIRSVKSRVGDADWITMAPIDGRDLWSAKASFTGGSNMVSITVEAIDEFGRPGRHTIQMGTCSYKPAVRVKDGSDAGSIGAWPENGIFGTRLGPNRNAKPSSKI